MLPLLTVVSVRLRWVYLNVAGNAIRYKKQSAGFLISFFFLILECEMVGMPKYGDEKLGRQLNR